MADDVQYVDGESSEYHGGENTYNEILLRQIQRCVDNLSREEVGGHMSQNNNYIEDVREQIINSVETLKQLLQPIIKDCDTVQSIINEVDNEYKRITEQEVIFNGQRVKISSLPVSQTQQIYNKYKDFKADKYRVLFGLLISEYHRRKGELDALSYE